MRPSLIILPGNESLGASLVEHLPCKQLDTTIRKFPDGETYVSLKESRLVGPIILLTSLQHPDEKILPLLFTAREVRERGGYPVILAIPYLAYMRQDKAFNPGEVITSHRFANLLSGYGDHLITIDPHLHRIKKLNEVYTISHQTLASAPVIASWIATNVEQPLVIGPDSESKQWVSEIAQIAKAPYTVFQKKRLADDRVRLQLGDLSEYFDHTPVVVDDIVSTAGTMNKTVKMLKKRLETAPICVGIHGIFAKNAYQALKKAGAAQVVTTNTIAHESNQIDVAPLLAGAIQDYLLISTKETPNRGTFY